MGRMQVRDNAVWAKHIEGAPEIVRTILELKAETPITLRVDGKPVRFVKMRDGKDGRKTNGLRPDKAFKPFWDAMQSRRGEIVEVHLDRDGPQSDPYLASISTLLSEWDSVEDAEAYDGL